MTRLVQDAQTKIIKERQRRLDASRQLSHFKTKGSAGGADPRAIAQQRFIDKSRKTQSANLAKEAALSEGKSVAGQEVAREAGVQAAQESSQQAATSAATSGATKAGVSMAGSATGSAIDEGGTTTSSSQGALGGAAKGAAIGFSVGGPYGAAIGAGIGAVSGIAKASANRKQRNREAASKQFTETARVEGQKQDRIQGALQDMRKSFSSALRVPQGVIRLGGR
jgi:hypothetical protein